MDNKTVSTIAINEAIDYMGSKFMARVDQNANEVVSHFKELTSRGILTSAEIDQIFTELESKIHNLKESFDATSSKLRSIANESRAMIEKQRSEAQNTLRNGV